MADPPRFRVSSDALNDRTVDIVGDELHHIRVLRLAVGDRIRLFDGAGGEVEAELTRLEPERAEAVIRRRLAAEGACSVDAWLVQAIPAKPARMDVVVRQSTELGVGVVVPVVTAHSHLSTARRRQLPKKVERWRRIAVEATKQCGRPRVPEIHDAVAWADLDWSRLPSPRLILDPGDGNDEAAGGEGAAGDGGGEAVSIGARVDPECRSVVLLIGPEGGWSADELDAARRHGAVVVRLGDRVLRTDTAGTAALAVVLHLAGEL